MAALRDPEMRANASFASIERCARTRPLAPYAMRGGDAARERNIRFFAGLRQKGEFKRSAPPQSSMWLVCLGLLIALPPSAWVMNKWLSSYAYHIQISWWMFLIPAVVVLLLALVVISKEIIKTALANPVTSLRSE